MAVVLEGFWMYDEGTSRIWYYFSLLLPVVQKVYVHIIGSSGSLRASHSNNITSGELKQLLFLRHIQWDNNFHMCALDTFLQLRVSGLIAFLSLICQTAFWHPAMEPISPTASMRKVKAIVWQNFCLLMIPLQVQKLPRTFLSRQHLWAVTPPPFYDGQ